MGRTGENRRERTLSREMAIVYREEDLPSGGRFFTVYAFAAEFVGGGSDKFYRLYLVDGWEETLLVRRWGRRGTSGQVKVEEAPMGGASETFYDLTYEKLTKGYQSYGGPSWYGVAGDEEIARLRRLCSEGDGRALEEQLSSWHDEVWAEMVGREALSRVERGRNGLVVVADLEMTMKTWGVAKKILGGCEVLCAATSPEGLEVSVVLVEACVGADLAGDEELTAAVVGGLAGGTQAYGKMLWAEAAATDTSAVAETALRLLPKFGGSSRWDEAVQIARTLA